MKRLGYLVAHACFACRRTFKRALRADRHVLCPACGEPVYPMGRAFKAPARGARGQWAKVQLLYAHGFRFGRYRSYDGPTLPRRLSEVAQFVKDNPRHPLRVAKPNRPLERAGMIPRRRSDRASAGRSAPRR